MMESNVFTSNEVFGFDIGTTNSVLTIQTKTGVPKVLNSYSGATTPSCVRFNEDGTVDIGKNPYKDRKDLNVVYSFKKHMGSATKVYKDLTAREVTSIFVKKMIEECKENHPEYKDVYKVQVSTPAYFDINQIMDTRLALEEAGYSVVNVNNEPTAAAMLYQQLKKVKSDILLYDLGGGTFDVVLVRNNPGVPRDTIKFYKSLGVDIPKVPPIIEIIDTAGDNHLGGDDIDEEAAKLFIKDNNLTDVTELQMREIILTAERVKKQGTPTKVESLNLVFKYSYVEEATHIILNKTLVITDEMLKLNPSVKRSELQCVLCGGSTKSRIIQEALASQFSVSNDIDPDLAVGVGNSVIADLASDPEGMRVINRLAKGVGLLVNNKIQYLANKGEVLPFSKTFTAVGATKGSDVMSLNLYQGDKLRGKPVHVTTLKMENIEDFDDEGYSKVSITLVVNATGLISINARSGSAHITQQLHLTEAETDDVNAEDYVHPDAKMYYKFLTAKEKYKNKQLDMLMLSYAKTGERAVAKEIAKTITMLAKA